MSEEDTDCRLDRLENSVFGDRDDPKARPGIIAEQARTNEILLELRGDLRRINWIILSGVVTGVLATLLKNGPLT